MNVLWVTNTLFPDLSKELGYKIPTVGGWMYGLANDLLKKRVSLTVVASSPKLEECHKSINEIEYYILKGKKPLTTYDVVLENLWKKVIQKTNPDIVHIHGVEYAHGLALMRACPNLNYIISIQGLTSVIARYYTGGIPEKEIRRSITLRDIIRQDTLLNAKKKFKIRGRRVEYEYLRRAKHVIGRTQWDQDHVRTINPNISYHFCNESLRDEFYTTVKWNIQSKKEHTIFLSQAAYPIKGLHKVLEAVYLIKEQFPNIQLRIAGADITKIDSLSDKLRLGGYGRYIRRLMHKYGLEENISFRGFLNAKDMVKEYLNCHLFVCPSSIENSPNSLGEAQILGVPCIASYVGGIPDMIVHGKTGLLYRFEEVEMLAQNINKLFTNDALTVKLSSNGIKIAAQRHNRNKNALKTMAIYKELIHIKEAIN